MEILKGRSASVTLSTELSGRFGGHKKVLVMYTVQVLDFNHQKTAETREKFSVKIHIK